MRRHGDVTIWVEQDAAGTWSAPKRNGRGGQRKYSDFAPETCLTLGLIFHQPLRQVGIVGADHADLRLHRA
ncbi:MAG: transposase [Paracoccaceae bacterium]